MFINVFEKKCIIEFCDIFNAIVTIYNLMTFSSLYLIFLLKPVIVFKS